MGMMPSMPSERLSVMTFTQPSANGRFRLMCRVYHEDSRGVHEATDIDAFVEYNDLDESGPVLIVRM